MDALSFLSFDINLLIAAYPGGIRFGKVYPSEGQLFFESHPFEVPQRKFDTFCDLLDTISKRISNTARESDNTTANFSETKIIVNKFTIVAKVSILN